MSERDRRKNNPPHVAREAGSRAMTELDLRINLGRRLNEVIADVAKERGLTRDQVLKEARVFLEKQASD